MWISFIEQDNIHLQVSSLWCLWGGDSHRCISSKAKCLFSLIFFMAKGNLKSNKHCFLPIRWGIPPVSTSVCFWIRPEAHTGKNFLFVSMEEGDSDREDTLLIKALHSREVTSAVGCTSCSHVHIFSMWKTICFMYDKRDSSSFIPFFVCFGFFFFLILYRFFTKQPLCALESIVHGISCISPALWRHSDSEMYTAYASLKL